MFGVLPRRFGIDVVYPVDDAPIVAMGNKVDLRPFLKGGGRVRENPDGLAQSARGQEELTQDRPGFGPPHRAEPQADMGVAGGLRDLMREGVKGGPCRPGRASRLRAGMFLSCRIAR